MPWQRVMSLSTGTLQLGGDGDNFVSIASPHFVSTVLLSVRHYRTDCFAKHLAYKSLKCWP